MRTLIVIALLAAVASAELDRFGAIETRPLWDRPAMGLTLQQEAEAALDRGNGRIVDEQTFTVESIRADRVLTETQRFWVERERQLRIDQAQQKAVVEVKREKIVEVESVRLAAERERWIRMMNKPRHGEAAVVDRQK